MATGFVDLDKSLSHCSEKCGSGYSEMDGSTRSRSKNGGSNA